MINWQQLSQITVYYAPLPIWNDDPNNIVFRWSRRQRIWSKCIEIPADFLESRPNK